jgi:hypothetical protein
MLKRIVRVIAAVILSATYILLILLSCVAASLTAVSWYYESLVGVALFAYSLLVFLVSLVMFMQKRFRARAMDSHAGLFVVYVVVFTFMGMILAVIFLMLGETDFAIGSMVAFAIVGPVIGFIFDYLGLTDFLGEDDVCDFD